MHQVFQYSWVNWQYVRPSLKQRRSHILPVHPTIYTANVLQHACSWSCTFLLLNQPVCAVRQLPVCLLLFFKGKKRTLMKELTFPRQKTFSTRHVPTIETETHQACPNNDLQVFISHNLFQLDFILWDT